MARGKTIALSIAGVGILVLLGGTVVLRERLLEEWHIHKLRTGDPEEARRAAEALGKMSSVRAVPALLEAPLGRCSHLAAWKAGRGVLKTLKLEDVNASRASLWMRLPFRIVPEFRGHLNAEEQTILIDSRTGAAFIARANAPPDTGAVDIFRWASEAIARMGDRAVPALESAAADEKLHAGARAFASFEIARRAAANPRIALEGGGTEISVEQRTSVPLPGSRDSVYLSAGDFEYRTVPVWLTPSTGGPLIEDHPLGKGEEVSVGGKDVLRLVDIRNRFIGTEEAMFRLREDRAE